MEIVGEKITFREIMFAPRFLRVEKQTVVVTHASMIEVRAGLFFRESAKIKKMPNSP